MMPRRWSCVRRAGVIERAMIIACCLALVLAGITTEQTRLHGAIHTFAVAHAPNIAGGEVHLEPGAAEHHHEAHLDGGDANDAGAHEHGDAVDEGAQYPPASHSDHHHHAQTLAFDALTIRTSAPSPFRRGDRLRSSELPIALEVRASGLERPPKLTGHASS